MKKLLLFLIMVFAIGMINLQNVSAWSYENSYDEGQAHSYVKVEGTYPTCEGQSHGKYCVGDYVADVSFVGDKFYAGYGYTAWTPHADSSGYSGIPLDSPGRKVLPTENGHPKGYIICAWDYDNVNGQWAWSAKCGGYLIASFNELVVVDCYDDSDCGYNEYCDRTGSDQDWTCKQKICETGEEKCIGKYLNKCGDNEWIDKGAVKDKCGVECLTDTDCPADTIDNKFCSNLNVMETHNHFSCVENGCSKSSKDVFVEECDYKCDSGRCSEAPFYKTSLFYISIGIAFLVIIISAIFLKKK